MLAKNVSLSREQGMGRRKVAGFQFRLVFIFTQNFFFLWVQYNNMDLVTRTQDS